jgi:hypothetical protein
VQNFLYPIPGDLGFSSFSGFPHPHGQIGAFTSARFNLSAERRCRILMTHSWLKYLLWRFREKVGVILLHPHSQ